MTNEPKPVRAAAEEVVASTSRRIDRPAMTGPAAWDDRYKDDGYSFGTAPNAFLTTQGALFRPGDKVLALADGEGRNGVWLAEQ